MKKQASTLVRPLAPHAPVPVQTEASTPTKEENLATLRRSLKQGSPLQPAQVLTLQRTLGNQVVLRLLENRPRPGLVQRISATAEEVAVPALRPPLPFLQDIPQAAQGRDHDQTMNAIAHTEQNRQFPLIGPQAPVTIFDQAANAAQGRDPLQTATAIQNLEQNRQNPVQGPQLPVTIFDQAANAAQVRDQNQTMNAIAQTEQNRQNPVQGPQMPVTIFDQAAQTAQGRDPVQTANAIQEMEQNRGLPVQGPQLPVTIFDQAAIEGSNMAAPNTGGLDAKDTKRHNRAKNDYMQEKAQQRRIQQQQVRIQQLLQPRNPNPMPPDLDAQLSQAAETSRQNGVQATEVSLARGRIQEAKTANTALIAAIQTLVNRSAAPSALHASYMNALEIAGVAANLVSAQAALGTAQGHDLVLNNSEAALNAAPVGLNTIQAAYAAASTVPVDVALLKTNIDADYTAHLTAQAVNTKIRGLINAAKADATKKLGGEAATKIYNERAGKDKTTIVADIAAAVQSQHNPSLSNWLKLLQIESKKGGQLRIKKLRSVMINGGTSYGSHLSVYMDEVAVPAAGVTATPAQVLDAILPPGYGSGAHLTLEYKGEIAPKSNPHYYRGANGGAGTFKQNHFPDGLPWTEAQTDMTKILNTEVSSLTERVQRFLDNLGRHASDV